MTDHTDTARALLRDAEHYLSALHGSVARHDNLAANLGCAGCELRDRIAAVLPELTAAAVPAGQAPDTGQAAEIERLRTENERMRHELEVMYGGAFDSLKPAPADRATCCCGEPDAPDVVHRADAPCYQVEPQQRVIAMAIARVDAHEWATGVPLESQPVWQKYLRQAESVLAVLPAPADRAPSLTEAERAMLRYALDEAQEQMLCVGDEFSEDDHDAIDSLRRLVDEAPQQPDTEAWDVPDARPGTTDYTLTRPAAVAQPEPAEAPVHGESVAALAGYGPDGRDQRDDDEETGAALARYIADQPMSSIQAAIRILGWPPLRFELVDEADDDHSCMESGCSGEPTVEQTAAGAQQPKEAPTVAYSGKGRTFCVRCPRPEGEDVPLTINDVDPWDLCPSCGRHVVDVAQAQQDGAAS